MSYALTPEQLGRGRTLRCAQCRHTWFATPADAVDADWAAPATGRRASDLDAELQAAFGEADGGEAGSRGDKGNATLQDKVSQPGKPAGGRGGAPRGKSAKPRPGRPSVSPLALLKTLRGKAWPALVAALVVAVLVLAVAERRAVVAALPGTARLFAAVGLSVNVRGLAFEGIRGQIVPGKDQSVLVVEGSIRNIRKEEVPVPPLAVSVRDGHGAEVYAYQADPPKSVLGPGETLAFTARSSAPPLDGRDVVVRFARNETGAPAAH